MEDVVLPPEAREYQRILDGQSREIRADVSMDRIVGELDGLSGAAAGALEPAPAVRFVAHGRATYGANTTGAYAKLIVLKLIEDYPSRVQRIALPDSIKALYPSTLHRIARGLTTVPHESYIATHGEVGVISTGHADFWRDLRLAAQLAVPLTTSRVLDRMTFLPRTFYRAMGPKENLRCLRFLVLRLHGLGPLFRTHIDERDLSELDDPGWDRAYLRIAEMLRLHRNIKGTVGTSWSLDPQLDHISPRRSYGRRNMLANGAFLHVEGPSELATQRALKKSATRRRAYERGEYIPTTYSVVWPRRDFLRWAASKGASQG